MEPRSLTRGQNHSLHLKPPGQQASVIIGLAKMNAVESRLARMRHRITAMNSLRHSLTGGRIDQSNTVPPKTGSAKTNPIDTRNLSEEFIQGNQLRAATFIIFDRTFSRL